MKLAVHVLLYGAAVSLVLTLAIGTLTSAAAPGELGRLIAEVWIYTILIATPAHWALPRLYPLVMHRRPGAQWAVFIVSLGAISMAGSLVGSAVVAVLELEPGITFGEIASRSVKLAVLLALLVGVVHEMVVVLQNRVYAAERKLRTQEIEHERALKLSSEARLAALEARIHPHFLFNTLNTVSSLIPTAPARAERLVERISALLRFSLDAHREGLVALRQEMKIVRDYLEIEQARFGPRLRFSIEMKDALAEKHVPPLSVQTLAENSVKYAVAPARDGAEIRIRTVLEAGWVRVEVTDTGPGFSITDVPAGRGLDNLRSRLDVLFGDAQPLSIARANGRTTVAFRVPA